MFPPEESQEAYRGRLYGSAISTYIVCMLVVPLKLWCRITKGGIAQLGADDLLCVVTLVLVNAFLFNGILGLGPSMGRHVGTQVSEPELEGFLKVLFAQQLLYLLCIAADKFCILAFYWRLFSIKGRVPILILFGIVSVWAIGLIIAAILSCKPIAAQWDPLIHGKCSGLRALYMGGSIPNILTDVAVLILPLPYIWQLNARLAQRLMLAVIFMLGCFVSVVSVLRLVHLMRVDLNSNDYTWKMKEVLLWSVVEVNVGLVCACLPSLKPAVQLLGLGRLMSSRYGTGPPSGHVHAPTIGTSDRIRSRKKSSAGGIFSSLAELTRRDGDSSEDSFQMINRAHGTAETRIGPATSIESLAERQGDGGNNEDKPPVTAISMKRDWSVLVEPYDIWANPYTAPGRDSKENTRDSVV